MKRILTLLLVIVLFVSLAASASAATVEPVQPLFTYIHLYNVDLSIDESAGAASCFADCLIDTGLTIVINGTLRQYKDGNWVDLKSWVSVGSRFASMENSWIVNSGYLYRFSVSYKVYNSSGILLESHSAFDSYVYPGT